MTYKTVTATIILVFIASSLLAQSQVFGDSIPLLINLGEVKRREDPPAAIGILTRAIKYSAEANDQRSLARSTFLRGQAEVELGWWANAARDFLAAREIYTKLGSKTEIGLCYNSMAAVHLQQEQLADALYNANIAEEYLKDDSVKLGRVLNIKGALYLQTKEYDKALAVYKRAHVLVQKEANPVLVSSVLNNLALTYDNLKDYEQSLFYYQKCLELSRGMNDKQGEVLALINIAAVYTNMGKYEVAEPFLKEALAMPQVKNNVCIYARCFIDLSAAKQKLKNLRESEEYALQGLRVATTEEGKRMLPAAYNRLSEIYREEGKPELALSYEKMKNRIKDSLLIVERRALVKLAPSITPTVTKRSPVTMGVGLMTFFFSLIIIAPALVFFFRKNKKVDTGEETQVSEEFEAVGVNTGEPELQSIEVINGEGLKIVPIEELMFIEKEGKAYVAMANNQKYTIGQNLARIEGRLPKQFFRINRQVIINTKFMNNYSFWENHKYILRMNDEKKTRFTIARSRLRELKKLLAE